MMNRTIKFRVWDVAAKLWRNFLYVDVVTGNVSGNDKTEYIITQYTGLVDKDGKEIYEGDIVGYQTYYTQYKTVYDVVCMRPPTLWLKNEKFGYEGERLIQPHETTVVGNILENPELLK